MAQRSNMTPLTELAVEGTTQKRIFVKHEHLGPTQSMKDRMVGRVLQAAIESGELKPGMEVVEASSGNTGAALAFAGSKLGLTVRIFVSSKVSSEKIEKITALGGIVHTIDVTDTVSEIEQAVEHARQHRAYLFNQFENPHHVPAYKATIGAELLVQLEEQKIRIDHFIAGIGSGGSIRAIGETLRERHNERLKIWAVVPAVYPSDIEGLNPGHLRRQGHFKIWNERQPGFESAIIEATDRDAFAEILALERAGGPVIGPASGSCLHVARGLSASGNILILLSDSGTKYERKKLRWST
jgi:cysteine synthase